MEDLEKLLEIQNRNLSSFIDLEKIYKNLNKIYKENENKNIYENKIAALILNYNSKISKNPDSIIEKYKKIYSIQTIPIINIENLKDIPTNNIFKYNIFYNFTDNNNHISPLIMAISNMHINIDLTTEDSNDDIIEKKIENLSINDIDEPLYFEVDINEGEDEEEYYEILLEINETSGYNIFISDSNPYPSIKNNITHFLNYKDNKKPIIRIKSKNIEKFYIGIEGILYFNMKITRKFFEKKGDEDELILSEGLYKYVFYKDTQVKLKDGHLNNIHTFSGDYKITPKVFVNDSIENIMKYFTRGIDPDNIYDYTFLNKNLFLYLFGEGYLINKIYEDDQKNYYFGRYIKLNEYTPSQLKYEEGFNRLTINKIYPFLKGNEILSDEAPSITFNEEEIKDIYNISFRKYLDELSNRIKKHQNCIKFEEQTLPMQFILFSLYFSYYYEANMLKNIINLSLKEPKYSDVIKFLKDKKQDDNAFLINYITQMEQESKSERIMTSIILGQSLMLSDIGIKFVKDFYNTMSKSKTKISVSVYDTLRSQNKINNIIPFFSTSNTKPEEISNYNSSNYYKKMKYNKTDEQNMDFDKILDFGLNQFSKYDVGIKKKIIIVCDENIFTKKKYYINNKLINLNNAKHMKLIENLIDLIIISPQNYEKGEVHELFNSKMLSKKKEEEIPYSIFENHFHVSNLNRTEIFMNDLGRVIKDSHIKMKVGKKIINDFNQGKMTYYKIYNKEFKSYVIVIKANFSNFNFYSSIEHPFPNSNTGNLLQKGDDAIVNSVKSDAGT